MNKSGDEDGLWITLSWVNWEKKEKEEKKKRK